MPPKENRPIIQVQHFTAAYDGSVVIDDISFEIYRGEVFAILGGSGSGKSTLLKHMIGLYRPAAGQIVIGGKDIVTADGEERINSFRPDAALQSRLHTGVSGRSRIDPLQNG